MDIRENEKQRSESIKILRVKGELQINEYTNYERRYNCPAKSSVWAKSFP